MKIKLNINDWIVVGPPGNIVFIGSKEDAEKVTALLQPFWNRLLGSVAELEDAPALEAGLN